MDQVQIAFVFRVLRTLLITLTFVGLVARASELHNLVHGFCESSCCSPCTQDDDHDSHDHDKEPHHCSVCSHYFCPAVLPDVATTYFFHEHRDKIDHHNESMPEDPVIPVDIPPIIA